MTKTKVILFWIFSFLAVLGGIAGYFELRNTKKPQTEALQVVPDSCLFYLSTADLHELENRVNQRNLITDQLRLLPQAAELFEALHLTDSILSGDEELKEQTLQSRFHLALYPQSQWLLCFTLRELGHQASSLEALRKKLNAQATESTLQFRFSNQMLYCSIREGIVRIASQLPLLRRSESASPRLADNPRFRQFYSTLTENKLLTIYADQTLLNAQSGKKTLALDLIIRNGFFSAAAEASPSELRINGFQYADSSEILSALLTQEQARTEDLYTMLPENTAWFEAFGCRDFEKINWRKESGEKDWWKKVNELALFNVEKQFYESCADLFVRFARPDNSLYSALLLNDTIKADEALKLMSDSTWQKDSIRQYRLSATNGIALLAPYLPEKLFYGVRMGTVLYFCAGKAQLAGLTESLRNNRYLESNTDLLAYSRQNLPELFHYLIYTSPLQTVKRPGSLINAQVTGRPYENFKHLSYALSGEKKYFKMRFHLMLQMGDADQKVLWTSKLDTTCSSSPYSFVNHNTSENEILIQDDGNTLYLINAKGAILWRKKLKEKIMSDIHQVDIYKNGKFQMVFNTRSALQLLDRNGKELPNFPVRLPAPASAGLSLFDYENTRDYRLVLPCVNRTIYNFTLEGKKLEGFTPVLTDYLVELPVQYVTVGPSQYLVALDKGGHIYTFSRKGLGRIGLKNKTTINCNSFYTDAGSNAASTQLIFLDEQTAMLHKISFTDVQHLSQLSIEASGAQLQFTQIDENRSVDVLVAAGQQVAAYDFSGNLIFEKTHDAVITKANYFADESHSQLLIFSQEQNTLRLIDLMHHTDKTVNATASGLPMDLFKDRHYYFVVPNGKDLSCIPLK